MGVSTIQDLLQHAGHDIVIAGYGPNGKPPYQNVSIECETCYEVLADAEDTPETLAAYQSIGKHGGHQLECLADPERKQAMLRCVTCQEILLEFQARDQATAEILTSDETIDNPMPAGTPVVLRSWGKDYHGAGCPCGKCNANGKSSGVAILEPRNMDDPVIVLYAPSEEAAEHNARLTCQRYGWAITELDEQGENG